MWVSGGCTGVFGRFEAHTGRFWAFEGVFVHDYRFLGFVWVFGPILGLVWVFGPILGLVWVFGVTCGCVGVINPWFMGVYGGYVCTGVDILGNRVLWVPNM